MSATNIIKPKEEGQAIEFWTKETGQAYSKKGEVADEGTLDFGGEKIISDSLQTDTITDEAGTGAPSFSFGLSAAGQPGTFDSIKSDTITNEAGSGPPEMTHGVKVDDDSPYTQAALTNYIVETGVTMACDTANECLSDQVTADFTRIGNIVFMHLTFAFGTVPSTGFRTVANSLPVYARPSQDLRFVVFFEASNSRIIHVTFTSATNRFEATCMDNTYANAGCPASTYRYSTIVYKVP